MDHYEAILYVRPPTPQISDFGGGFGFSILGILDFGFWGFWISDFGDLGFWILGILDFGFWILGSLDLGFWGRNPKSKIPNPNFFGQIMGILDFGSLCSNSLCEAPTSHILDFGGDFEFWILEVGDSGFWTLGILDFGFWTLGIVDFGFWGFWILDFWNIM